MLFPQGAIRKTAYKWQNPANEWHCQKGWKTENQHAQLFPITLFPLPLQPLLATGSAECKLLVSGNSTGLAWTLDPLFAFILWAQLRENHPDEEFLRGGRLPLPHLQNTTLLLLLSLLWNATQVRNSARLWAQVSSQLSSHDPVWRHIWHIRD